MNKIKIWILASRPKTLCASIVPVLMGGAMAYHDGQIRPLIWLITLLAAVLIQIGTNFSNDYYDFIKGADTKHRLGPTRVTQAGLVSLNEIKFACVIAYCASSLLGLILVYVGGLPIIIIGILAIVSGILYTAGPYALGYLGLGELFVLIFFGPIAVAGTYYLQTNLFNPAALFAGLAPGMLSVAILIVNNLRDLEQDLGVHKKTLAVRFGKKFAQYEYATVVLLAILVPMMMWLVFKGPIIILLSSCALFLSFSSVRTIFNFTDARVLNAVLERTGKLSWLFGIFFSIGYIL
ncbi:MAG: 1,4-dihydroxy-2-naphthoate polyprenyltransferase [bacterium]|nr:1,4-dihydroxy-2-naphthoate polyprenyltransferase [bacterium]